MMDAEERRVAFAKAVERSRLMLDADSCRETIVAETVTRAIHRDDGYSSDWAAGMPRREPAPAPRSLGTAEIEKLIDRRINTALAGLPRAVTPQATATIVHEVRQQLRQEFAAEIEKLRAEVAEKLPREGGSAEVLDLPGLGALRSARRAG